MTIRFAPLFEYLSDNSTRYLARYPSPDALADLALLDGINVVGNLQRRI